MSLGIIARADNSGLATQTWEMARHTRPAKVLVVHPKAAERGPFRPERYDGLGTVTTTGFRHGQWLDQGLLESWLDGLSVVYTAESDYGAPLALRCALRNIKLVVHANPELWSERLRDSTTTVVTPTTWELERIPGARCMPMPVDRERLPFRQRTEAKVFWHPAAPAFHDRHGTDTFRAALKCLTLPLEIVVSGTSFARVRHAGGALVRFVPPRTNYWDGYDDADVLVLPRRYGGLSLPVQEALSAGMPVVMLDTGPYAGQPGVLTTPVTQHYDAAMKGGIFAVHSTDPALLAHDLEELFLDPGLTRNASMAADRHAATLDWRDWESKWQALLS